LNKAAFCWFILYDYITVHGAKKQNISTLHGYQEGYSNIGTPSNGFVFRTEGCLSFSSRGRKTSLSQSNEFLSPDAHGRSSSQNQEPRLRVSIYWLCTTRTIY